MSNLKKMLRSYFQFVTRPGYTDYVSREAIYMGILMFWIFIPVYVLFLITELTRKFADWLNKE